MTEFIRLVEAISLPKDKLGRRNAGFRHINNSDYKTREELVTRIDLLTTEEQNIALCSQAAKRGISKSELIRTYIEWGLENEEG